MLPTYRQEMDYDLAECEACGDYVHESTVKWESVDMHGTEVLGMSNNAEGPEVALCVDCHGRVVGEPKPTCEEHGTATMATYADGSYLCGTCYMDR